MSEKEHPGFEVILHSRRVQRELDSLQEADYQRGLTSLRALAGIPKPRGCEKLYDDIYRVRVGDTRILYLIDEVDRRIEVGGIRRRSEQTYRGIENLFR